MLASASRSFDARQSVQSLRVYGNVSASVAFDCGIKNVLGRTIAQSQHAPTPGLGVLQHPVKHAATHCTAWPPMRCAWHKTGSHGEPGLLFMWHNASVCVTRLSLSTRIDALLMTLPGVDRSPCWSYCCTLHALAGGRPEERLLKVLVRRSPR